MKTLSAQDVNAIPMRQSRCSEQIVYQSALPRLLARSSPQQVDEIARCLLAQIEVYQQNYSFNSQYLLLPLAAVWEWGVEATPTGELHITLLDGAIAHWLNTLPSLPRQLPVLAGLSPSSNQAQRLFAIQHAHARCCSLLRHAHCGHWITQLYPSNSSVDQLKSSEECLYPISPQQLQWLHPVERQLVNQLVKTLDLLAKPPQQLTKHIFHHLEVIGATFERCHRGHPLFSQSQNLSSDRPTMVLRLLALTQGVLFHLLEHLSFVAPFEL